MTSMWKTLLAAAVAAVGLGAGAASAATQAGTTIVNTIDLQYASGGKTISVPAAASTTFVVDRKVDAILTPLNAGGIAAAVPGQDAVTLSFSIENTGNDDSGYDIDITPSGTSGAMTYSASAVTTPGAYWVVLSDSPTPGAGTETAYNPAGVVNAGDLAEGGMRYVHIYANVPTSAVSAQEYIFAAAVTALQPGTTTPYAPAGTGDLATVDTVIVAGTTNLVMNETQTIRINAPELSATKTAKVIDNGLGTFDCATGAVPAANDIAALPGGCILYTVTLTNAASATDNSTSVVMTDALPDDLEYVTSAAGTFDTVTWDAGTETLTATLATLAPGASASFTLRARIED